MRNFRKNKNLIKILVLFSFLAIGIRAEATQIGESQIFNVDPFYDLSERSQITATLVKTTSQLYFYIDNAWWNQLTPVRQEEIKTALSNLAKEFEERIYPILTSNFGFEWKPGIDGDEKITILIHPIIKDAGGYFNNGDEYSKIQNPGV